MARIAGVDLPRNKHIVIALTYIFGIGISRANKIVGSANVEPAKKVSDLNEDEVNRIRQVIEQEGNVEGDLRKDVTDAHQAADRNRFLSWLPSSPQPAGPGTAHPHQRPHPQGSAQGYGREQEKSSGEDIIHG